MRYMNSRQFAVAAGLVMALVATALALWWFTTSERQIEAREDVFRYGFTVKNESNELVQEPSFVAYGPANLPFAQEVHSLEATHPYSLETDAYGNQVMRFDLGPMAPYSSKIVTVTAQVRRFSGYREADGDAVGSRVSQPFIESDAPLVKELAANLQRSTENESASEVISLLRSRLTPEQYIREDKGALWALREGRGDCTEFMYAFSALMRATGVETLEFGGFRVREGRLHSTQYHNWSAYRDDDRWVLVDAQNGLHDDNYFDYLLFRVFHMGATHALSNTHRFISLDPRLKVVLND